VLRGVLPPCTLGMTPGGPRWALSCRAGTGQATKSCAKPCYRYAYVRIVWLLRHCRVNKLCVFNADLIQGTTSVVSPWAFGPPKGMKTVLNHSPRRGRRIIAQDKRSAVLGKADKWSQSPVGATEMTAKILKGIADVFDRADKANKMNGALAPES